MSLIMTGTLIDVTERHVVPNPAKGHTWAAFVERTLHVLDGRRVHRIRLGKDFRGDVATLTKHQEVALQVSVQAYPMNSGTTADWSLVAWEDLTGSVKVSGAAGS